MNPLRFYAMEAAREWTRLSHRDHDMPFSTFRPSRHCLRPAVALAALAAGLAGLPGPAQAAKFDGRWSVVIVTQSGDCDPAYRYEVQVADGKVSYAGSESFDVSGSVASSGAVNVAISRGAQRASGAGRLAGNGGSGTWSGKSSTSACSGRWEAERR